LRGALLGLAQLRDRGSEGRQVADKREDRGGRTSAWLLHEGQCPRSDPQA
jgi:hypothetical protein